VLGKSNNESTLRFIVNSGSVDSKVIVIGHRLLKTVKINGVIGISPK
jgi:hypothetical protein